MLITTNQAIPFFLVVWSVLVIALNVLIISAGPMAWQPVLFLLYISVVMAVVVTLWSCRICYRMQMNQERMHKRGEDFEAAAHAIFKAEGRLAYADMYSREWGPALEKVASFVRNQTPQFREELARRVALLTELRSSFTGTYSVRKRRSFYAKWRKTVLFIDLLVDSVRAVKQKADRLQELADRYVDNRALPQAHELEQALQAFQDEARMAEEGFLQSTTV